MNDDKFEPGPLAEVEYRTNGTRATLVFVRQLHHPPTKVWAALTDPALLRQWAPFAADRNLGDVGEATLSMIDEQDATLPARVTRSEPPTLLEYTWGDDVLRWQLDATEEGTRLTLHHTTDDPTMIPKAAAGWHICLVVAEGLLDGHPIGPIVGEEAMQYGWQDLHDSYAKALEKP
jgi:uncharacterized protein YndB with AHSA1/START domain